MVQGGNGSWSSNSILSSITSKTVTKTVAGQGGVSDTMAKSYSGETGVPEAVTSDGMVKTMEVTSEGTAGQSEDNAGTDLEESVALLLMRVHEYSNYAVLNVRFCCNHL